jgi:hypothetical protein
MSPNTTCDICRSLGSTVAVAAVPCYLRSTYYQGLEHGEGDPTANRYDHVLYVDSAVDVRDSYNLGTITANSMDAVWIPNQATGTKFSVTFVERRYRGLPGDHKRAYLQRANPTWPTANL